MEYDILRRALLPLLFALAAAASVSALRVFGRVSRLRGLAVATGFLAGCWVSVTGSGIAMEDSLRQGLATLAILAGAATALRLADLVFWDWFLARRRHTPVPKLLVDLLKLLAMVGVGLAILKNVYGRELGGLLVTSTVLSAVVGLALQDMLGNIAAGLGFQMEKPFRVGDWLFLQGKEGIVTQLSWRSVTLLTRDGGLVIVPNAMAAKSEIANNSRPTRVQRLHVAVGVAYHHPPGIVKEALRNAAESAPDVLADPPVEILIRAYRDFAIEYDVRFWVDGYDRVYQASDDVLSRIWYELRRRGITIPLPVRDVNLRTITEEQEARAAETRSREIFSVLRRLPVFEPLSDAQVEVLVAGAALRGWMAGEALVHQGDEGASLFVLRSGRARVEKSSSSGRTSVVASLGPGDFFGEMSLLTGAPRNASVVADAETEAVVVDKAAFAAVVSCDSGLLPGLSAALESRAGVVEETLGEGAGPGARQPGQRTALLRRIGHFFGIDED